VGGEIGPLEKKNSKIVKLSHKLSISFPSWFFNSQTRGRFSLLSPFPSFHSLPLLSLSFPFPQNSQTKPFRESHSLCIDENSLR